MFWKDDRILTWHLSHFHKWAIRGILSYYHLFVEWYNMDISSFYDFFLILKRSFLVSSGETPSFSISIALSALFSFCFFISLRQWFSLLLHCPSCKSSLSIIFAFPPLKHFFLQFALALMESNNFSPTCCPRCHRSCFNCCSQFPYIFNWWMLYIFFL